MQQGGQYAGFKKFDPDVQAQIYDSLRALRQSKATGQGAYMPAYPGA